jgi:hypothetical protein
MFNVDGNAISNSLNHPLFLRIAKRERLEGEGFRKTAIAQNNPWALGNFNQLLPRGG